MSYKCPKCHIVSGSSGWNVATIAEYLTSDIVRIEEALSESASFVCPECYEESEGFEIETVNADVSEQVNLSVKIRKVRPHAVVPTYGTAGAACFDLYAAEDVIIAPGETVAVPVGIAVELPDGYEIQIRPRSGMSLKTKLRVANSPGCVDSDFRGEVAVIFDNISQAVDRVARKVKSISGDIIASVDRELFRYDTYIIRRGDRIAQAAVVPIPRVTFVEVDEELTQTERGAGGFGHTGVN